MLDAAVLVGEMEQAQVDFVLLDQPGQRALTVLDDLYLDIGIRREESGQDLGQEKAASPSYDAEHHLSTVDCATSCSSY